MHCANCKVKSVNKVGKVNTVTLSYKDDLDVEHDKSFEVLDGEDSYTAGSGIDIDEGVISTKLDPNSAIHVSSDGLNINTDNESIEIDNNELKAKIDTNGGLETSADGIGVKAGSAIYVDSNGVNVLTKLNGGIISDPNGSGLMLDDSYFSKLIDTPLTEAQILNFVVENVNKEVNGFFYNSDINAYCSFSGLYMSKTTSGTEVHYGYCNIRGIHETEYLIDYRIDWEDSDNWYKVKIVTDSDLDDVYTKTETDDLLDDKADFNSVNQNWQGNGYNLFKFPYAVMNYAKNGVRYVANSDGSIDISGEATDTSDFDFISYREGIMLPKGKYMVLCEETDTNKHMQVNLYDGNTYKSTIREGVGEFEITQSIIDTGYVLRIYYRCSVSRFVDTAKIYPMLVKVNADGTYPTEYQRYAMGNVELTDKKTEIDDNSISQNKTWSSSKIAQTATTSSNGLMSSADKTALEVLKAKIPNPPDVDGKYFLEANVQDGLVTYEWSTY